MTKPKKLNNSDKIDKLYLENQRLTAEVSKLDKLYLGNQRVTAELSKLVETLIYLVAPKNLEDFDSLKIKAKQIIFFNSFGVK